MTASVAVCADLEIRERVAAALGGDGLTTLHERSDLGGMLGACSKDPPDIAVIAAPRPDGSTLEGMRSLAKRTPPVRVVMICGRSADGDIRRALGAGATGIVLADEIEEALLPVVRVVHAGQVSVPASRSKEVRERVLTTREKQILGLVVMGMTNAQIAGKLYLAESTVKSHLSSAFAKLEVSSRNEAVNLILDPQRGKGLGILSIPSEQITTRRGSLAQGSR